LNSTTEDRNDSALFEQSEPGTAGERPPDPISGARAQHAASHSRRRNPACRGRTSEAAAGGRYCGGQDAARIARPSSDFQRSGARCFLTRGDAGQRGAIRRFVPSRSWTGVLTTRAHLRAGIHAFTQQFMQQGRRWWRLLAMLAGVLILAAGCTLSHAQL